MALSVQEYSPPKIPIALIKPGSNDRRRFNPKTIQELAHSIQSEGLLQPITVRPIEDPQYSYEIVAGERRFRAHLLLKAPEIECYIKPMDDSRASAAMLLENMARENLAPTDEASAYKKRLDEGWTCEEISAKVGVSVETVKRRVLLLQLPDYIRKFLDAEPPNNLPVTYADAMVHLDAQRCQMAWRIWLRSDRGISNYAFADICAKLQAEQDQGALFEMEDFFLEAVGKTGRALQNHTVGSIREDLPALDASFKDTCGTAIERYLLQLRKGGFTAEAEVVGALYMQLLGKKLIRAKLI